jgi:hypothetical protein
MVWLLGSKVHHEAAKKRIETARLGLAQGLGPD